MTDSELVIVPSSHGEYVTLSDDEAETIKLSRKREVQGKLFRKELIKNGTFFHPVTHEALKFDDKFINTMKKNFDDGVCPIVQVPVADDGNRHTQDPFRNIGEVVDITQEDGKVYAVIDVRNEIAASHIGTTLLGISAMIDPNRYDSRDGKYKGPTLIHTLVTNNPVITDLDEYKELIAASVDNTSSVVLLSQEEFTENKEEVPEVIPEISAIISGVTSEQMAEIKAAMDKRIKEEVEVILLSKVNQSTVGTTQVEEIIEAGPEENDMPQTLEELLAELKDKHGVDVKALQESSTKATKELEEATALSNTLTGQAEETAKKLNEHQEMLVKMSQQLDSVGVIKLSNGEDLTPEDVLGAVAELSQNHLVLSTHVQELREKDARVEVQKLVDDEYLFPAQLDGFVKMKLEHPDIYEMSVPKEKHGIQLSHEIGVTPEDAGKEVDADAYIAKLSGPGGALSEFINRSKSKK